MYYCIRNEWFIETLVSFSRKYNLVIMFSSGTTDISVGQYFSCKKGVFSQMAIKNN